MLRNVKNERHQSGGAQRTDYAFNPDYKNYDYYSRSRPNSWNCARDNKLWYKCKTQKQITVYLVYKFDIFHEFDFNYFIPQGQ